MFDIDKILFMRNTGKILPDAKIEDILFAKKLRSAMEKFVTIVGNPLNFTTRKAQLAKSTKISMEPIQEGSGDPSPSNIRPISGRTGVYLAIDDEAPDASKNAVITSKQAGSGDPSPTNIRPISGVEITGIGTVYGGTLDVETGELTVDRAITDMGDLTWTKYVAYTYIFFLADLSSLGTKTASTGDTDIISETYKVIGATTLGGKQGFGHNPHDGEICQQSFGTACMVQDSRYSSITASAFKSAMSGHYLVYTLATPVTYQLTDAQIAEVLNKITISFGETVYGGTLDVEKGELTVTHKYVDLGTLSWDYNTDNSIFIVTSTTKLTDAEVDFQEAFCSRYNFDGSCNGTSVSRMAQRLADKEMCVYSNEAHIGRLVVKDSSYTDAEVFTESLIGTQFVYPLATPITISLTPEQVQLLKGVNNLWTDGDSIELTYKA